MDCVAEGGGPEMALRTASRGEEKMPGGEETGRQCKFEMGLFFFDFFNALAKADFHAEMLCFVQEAVDDRGGLVADGKDPAVLFGFQGHSARFEPLDRIAGLEAVEGADEFF